MMDDLPNHPSNSNQVYFRDLSLKSHKNWKLRRSDHFLNLCKKKSLAIKNFFEYFVQKFWWFCKNTRWWHFTQDCRKIMHSSQSVDHHKKCRAIQWMVCIQSSIMNIEHENDYWGRYRENLDPHRKRIWNPTNSQFQ